MRGEATFLSCTPLISLIILVWIALVILLITFVSTARPQRMEGVVFQEDDKKSIFLSFDYLPPFFYTMSYNYLACISRPVDILLILYLVVVTLMLLFLWVCVFHSSIGYCVPFVFFFFSLPVDSAMLLLLF